MALKDINHVVLNVRDLDRSAAFYQMLGFRQTGHYRNMRFYTAGHHIHDLALAEIGEDAPPAPKEATGMQHFCVTVEEERNLAELHATVLEAGFRVIRTTDHGVSRSFYCEDPDGNVVEFTWDTPEADWAHQENPFARNVPYTLPTVEKG